MHFLWAVAVGAGAGALWFTLCVHYAHTQGRGHPRAHLHVAQHLHRHLSVAFLVALVGGFVGGAFAATTTLVILHTPSGMLVEPPVVAQQPSGVRGGAVRALGFVPQKGRVGRPQTFSVAPVPASVDLTSYVPPVAYQGPVSDCASWAVGYYARGYYARRVGHYPRGGLAPMFLYAQLTRGSDSGTTFPANLTLLAQQGIASLARYPQGNYALHPLPTRAQIKQAGRWKTQGYHTLFVGDHQGMYAEQAIKEALAHGDPVVLGLPVYQNFINASASSYLITGVVGSYYGAHAVVVAKYDLGGVFAVNEWGTSWGLGGYVEMTWAFINRWALEADVIVGRA